MGEGLSNKVYTKLKEELNTSLKGEGQIKTEGDKEVFKTGKDWGDKLATDLNDREDIAGAGHEHILAKQSTEVGRLHSLIGAAEVAGEGPLVREALKKAIETVAGQENLPKPMIWMWVNEGVIPDEIKSICDKLYNNSDDPSAITSLTGDLRVYLQDPECNKRITEYMTGGQDVAGLQGAANEFKRYLINDEADSPYTISAGGKPIDPSIRGRFQDYFKPEQLENIRKLFWDKNLTENLLDQNGLLRVDGKLGKRTLMFLAAMHKAANVLSGIEVEPPPETAPEAADRLMRDPDFDDNGETDPKILKQRQIEAENAVRTLFNESLKPEHLDKPVSSFVGASGSPSITSEYYKALETQYEITNGTTVRQLATLVGENIALAFGGVNAGTGFATISSSSLPSGGSESDAVEVPSDAGERVVFCTTFDVEGVSGRFSKNSVLHTGLLMNTTIGEFEQNFMVLIRDPSTNKYKLVRGSELSPGSDEDSFLQSLAALRKKYGLKKDAPLSNLTTSAQKELKAAFVKFLKNNSSAAREEVAFGDGSTAAGTANNLPDNYNEGSEYDVSNESGRSTAFEQVIKDMLRGDSNYKEALAGIVGYEVEFSPADIKRNKENLLSGKKEIYFGLDWEGSDANYGTNDPRVTLSRGGNGMINLKVQNTGAHTEKDYWKKIRNKSNLEEMSYKEIKALKKKLKSEGKLNERDGRGERGKTVSFSEGSIKENLLICRGNHQEWIGLRDDIRNR